MKFCFFVRYSILIDLVIHSKHIKANIEINRTVEKTRRDIKKIIQLNYQRCIIYAKKKCKN